MILVNEFNQYERVFNEIKYHSLIWLIEVLHFNILESFQLFPEKFLFFLMFFLLSNLIVFKLPKKKTNKYSH